MLKLMIPNRVLRIGLLLLPLVWGYPLLDPFHAYRWVTLALISFVMLLGIALPTKLGWVLSKTEILIMGLATLVMALSWISTGLALDLSESLWQSVQTTTWLLFLLCLLLAAPSKPAFWVSVRRIAICVAMIGSLVVSAEISGLWQSPFDSSWGPVGMHGNRNLLVTFQVLLAPWIVWACFDEVGSWRVLGGISWLFFSFHLAHCQSRGAWLAMAAGIVWSFLGIAGKGWGSFQRSMPKAIPSLTSRAKSFAVVVFLALSLVAVFAIENATRKESHETPFSQRLISITHLENASIHERLVLWEKTLSLIRQHPFLGVGAGQWKIVLPSQGMNGLPTTDMSVMQTRPHNDWLWVASEVGVVGGLAWFAIPCLALGIAGWRLRSLPLSPLSRGAWFASSGVLGYLVFATFDFPRERAEHMMWSSLLCVAALGISRLAADSFVPDKETTNEFPSRNYVSAGRLPKWLLVIALAMALGSFVFSGLRVWAESRVYHMIGSHKAKDWEGLLGYSQGIPAWLCDLTPAGSPLLWHQGIAQVELNRWREAEADFLEALKVHPFHLPLLNNLAVCRIKSLDTLSAIEYLERIALLRSYDSQSAITLAWLKWRRGDLAGAKSTLQKVSFTQRNQAWEALHRLSEQ